MDVDGAVDAGQAARLRGALADLLRSDAPGEDVVGRSLAAVRETLGLECAFVAEFTAGRRVFRWLDGDATSFGFERDAGDPLDASLCGAIVAGQVPEVLPDVHANETAARLESRFAADIGAYIGVPIELSDGTVYGTLCAAAHAPVLHLDERDVRFLRTVARLLGHQLESGHLRRKLLDEIRTRIDGLLDRGGLQMVFQPIVRLADGSRCGVEALARFEEEPARPPNEWFDDAAAVGRAEEVEAVALRSALSRLPGLADGVYLSVNASPALVLSDGFAGAFDHIDVSRVVVEVTEHARIDDYAVFRDALGPLRDRGLRLAIDDAGAGYASLAHVLHLRPELIKLDMSLTRGIHGDPLRRSLAGSLVGFADSLEATIVAEGVETVEERDELQSLGVQLGQGWLFGRPGPLPDLRAPVPRAVDRRASSTSSRMPPPGSAPSRGGAAAARPRPDA